MGHLYHGYVSHNQRVPGISQTEKSCKSGYECGIAKAELTPRVAPY